MRTFIDVDDTLAAFRQHAIANGVPPWEGSWYTTSRGGWTEEQKFTQDRINGLMRQEDFWMTMPLVPGAHELISAASFHGPVTLLTALPFALSGEPAMLGMIRRAKRAYCWQRLHVPPESVIIVNRREKVLYAFDQYEKRGNVLIDDAEQTCAEWTAARGLAFHIARCEDGLDEALNFIKCL